MTHTHTHVIHVCVRACAGARACARACVFVFVCVCVCVCVYACESPGASATIRPTASCPRAPRSASAAARSHCRHTVAAVGSSLHVPPHVPRPIRGAPGQVPLRAAAVGLGVAAAPNPARLARTRRTLHQLSLFQLLRFRAHTHARTHARTRARTHARTHAHTHTHISVRAAGHVRVARRSERAPRLSRRTRGTRQAIRVTAAATNRAAPAPARLVPARIRNPRTHSLLQAAKDWRILQTARSSRETLRSARETDRREGGAAQRGPPGCTQSDSDGLGMRGVRARARLCVADGPHLDLGRQVPAAPRAAPHNTLGPAAPAASSEGLRYVPACAHA